MWFYFFAYTCAMDDIGLEAIYSIAGITIIHEIVGIRNIINEWAIIANKTNDIAPLIPSISENGLSIVDNTCPVAPTNGNITDACILFFFV